MLNSPASEVTAAVFVSETRTCTRPSGSPPTTLVIFPLISAARAALAINRRTTGMHRLNVVPKRPPGKKSYVGRISCLGIQVACLRTKRGESHLFAHAECGLPCRTRRPDVTLSFYPSLALARSPFSNVRSSNTHHADTCGP